MPMYTFECPKCGQFDSFVSAKDMCAGHREPCPNCEEGCKRQYLPGRTQVNAGFQPYESSDFNGEPIYVSSQKQEAELCRIHGVRRATSDECTGKPRKKRKLSDSLPPLHEDLKRTAMDLKYGNIPPPPPPIPLAELERMPIA